MKIKILSVIFFILIVQIITSYPNLEGLRFFSMIPFDYSSGVYVFKENNKFEYIKYGGDAEGNREGTYKFGTDNFGEYIDFSYRVSNVTGVYDKEIINERKYFVFEKYILILYTEDKYNAWVLNTKENYYLYNNYDIKASTTLVEFKDKPDLYSPNNLIDTSDLKKFWAEGKKGDGINETITFDFGTAMAPREIHGLIIFNGVHKSKDLYEKNSRVNKAVLTFSNGKKYNILLKDKRGPQIIWLDKIGEDITNSVFKIESVYKGSKWDDTCLTKLIFFGYQVYQY